MKKYSIVEVSENIHMISGEVLNQDNLIQTEMEQTAINGSTSEDIIFDTLEDAQEAIKNYHSKGRVDMARKGKGRYWEVSITTYQLTEINVNDDGEILDWGDVLEITPFRIEIDPDGKVSKQWS